MASRGAGTEKMESYIHFALGECLHSFFVSRTVLNSGEKKTMSKTDSLISGNILMGGEILNLKT